ncbi:hypothetical protein ABT040_34070 [Streptomyces sp. NPDC002688]
MRTIAVTTSRRSVIPGHRKVPLPALATTPANESAAAASRGAAMK